MWCSSEGGLSTTRRGCHLSAGWMLAAAAKLGLLTGFLAVFAAILAVRTTLATMHSQAGCAHLFVSAMTVTSRPTLRFLLYAIKRRLMEVSVVR